MPWTVSIEREWVLIFGPQLVNRLLVVRDPSLRSELLIRIQQEIQLLIIMIQETTIIIAGMQQEDPP